MPTAIGHAPRASPERARPPSASRAFLLVRCAQARPVDPRSRSCGSAARGALPHTPALAAAQARREQDSALRLAAARMAVLSWTWTTTIRPASSLPLPFAGRVGARGGDGRKMELPASPRTGTVPPSQGHHGTKAARRASLKIQPFNMQAPYLPAADAAFDAWFANFSALITANPTDFGLVSGDATTIAASFTSWHAAYLLATNPSTRTSPAIAAKDAERFSAEAVIRPYATQISRNPAVLNADKTAVGVNLPNTSRTPVPPPTTQPTLSLVSAIHNLQTLAYRDSATPTTKAKPPGAIGMELWRTIATTPATDPSAAELVGIVTKSPANIGTSSGDAGKFATYFGRWTTRSGPGGVAQVGPWSAPLAVVIV